MLWLYSEYWMPDISTEDYSQLHFFGDTVHERLRYWRTAVARVSQASLCNAVNRRMPDEGRVAVTTVSNYERTTEPRASFLAALRLAYPALSLEWLVTGEGRPLGASRGTLQMPDGTAAPAEQEWAAGLLNQPGMHRFRVLPLAATHVLLAFLDEVRQSEPDYQLDQSRSWRDFLQRFSHFFFEPFQSTRHFSALEGLTDGELINYTLAVVGAARPLVSSIRRSGRITAGEP
jgi:hypothetical protein